MGFFLGMESGGDVKFYSPGAPVSPHFSFSHQLSNILNFCEGLNQSPRVNSPSL